MTTYRPTVLTAMLISALALGSAGSRAGAESPPLPGATPGAIGTLPPPTATPAGPLGQTPPPLSATATPAPAGQVVRYSGRLLDVRGGFVFFTTGDGFKLDPAYTTVSAADGGPTTLVPATRTYARATFDTATGKVVQLALSRAKLPDEAGYEAIKRYAVARSTPFPNPDLKGGEGLTGKPVLVTFLVRVPARTPFSDSVYLATDASGWSATAIKMDRVDALHYRVTRDLPSGARILYRYTRGSWRSAERGQDGLEIKPHELSIKNLDVFTRNDTVYHWGDEDQAATDLGPNGLPTPYNAVPFPRPPR